MLADEGSGGPAHGPQLTRSGEIPGIRYAGIMKHDDHLKQHLELCKRIYLRMLRDNTWPWPESHNCEDLVDCDQHSDKL